MPVKLGLEFVTIVGADFLDPKRELLDDMINEVDRVSLRVFRINFEWVLSDERELVSVCGSAVTIYAAESRCHSTRAASRFALKSFREMRCLSWLK